MCVHVCAGLRFHSINLKFHEYRSKYGRIKHHFRRVIKTDQKLNLYKECLTCSG